MSLCLADEFARAKNCAHRPKVHSYCTSCPYRRVSFFGWRSGRRRRLQSRTSQIGSLTVGPERSSANGAIANATVVFCAHSTRWLWSGSGGLPKSAFQATLCMRSLSDSSSSWRTCAAREALRQDARVACAHRARGVSAGVTVRVTVFFCHFTSHRAAVQADARWRPGRGSGARRRDPKVHSFCTLHESDVCIFQNHPFYSPCAAAYASASSSSRRCSASRRSVSFRR